MVAQFYKLLTTRRHCGNNGHKLIYYYFLFFSALDGGGGGAAAALVNYTFCLEKNSTHSHDKYESLLILCGISMVVICARAGHDHLSLTEGIFWRALLWRRGH